MRTRANDTLITLAQLIHSGRDFQAYRALLAQADALGLLEGNELFTVFAPIDLAFTPTARSQLGDRLETLKGVRELALHHVVRGSWGQGELERRIGKPLTSMADRPLSVERSDDRLVIAGVHVYAESFEARNGVLYLVDGLLVPPLTDHRTGAETLREVLVEPPHQTHHSRPGSPK